jgi:D-3-phosphoglycerate dehydrogenase / 2-oxoglutarate reductase
MANTVIITAPAHEILAITLKERGFKVIYNPSINYDDLLTQIENVVGLIVSTRLPINRQLIDAATHLKWIGRLGSGMELIDVAYATSKGIYCCSSPEGNRNAVAEHVLALLLALMNNLVKSNNQVKKYEWQRDANRGDELSGKTVGIIGYGNTGMAVAKILSGFNVKVLGYDKYKTNYGHDIVKESTLLDICKLADIVTLHLPLTTETTYFANDSFFNAFEKKPYFINASRGKIVDTQALIQALQNEKIIAAGLDVLENEKLTTLTVEQKIQFDLLNSFSNVIITPHIAGYSHESYIGMSQILLKKLLN